MSRGQGARAGLAGLGLAGLGLAGLGLAGLGLVLVVACNQLTGVDDLEFRDPPPSEMALMPVLPDVCDLLMGGGCEAGQTCRFDADRGERVCRAAPLASLEPYGLCTVDDECPVAHRCLDGVCSKVCDSPAECEGANALCLDEPDSGLGVCTRPCDLVAPDAPRAGLQACGAGARCEYVRNGSYTSCFGPGSSFAGGPCQADRECPASFLCVASRCTRACDASGGSCGLGQACGGFVDYAGQSVGSCCSVPEGELCDLVSNCGCAAGESCDHYDVEPNYCRVLPPNPVAANARCDLGSDCSLAHTCVGLSCSLLCKSDADCTGEGELCIETQDLAGNLNLGLRVCARGCDVLAPFESSNGFLACGEGTVCSPYVSQVGPTTFCFGAGEVPVGGRCLFDTDCAPGLLCGSGACGEPCEVGGTSCGVNGECRAIGELAGRDFGACCTIPEGEVCDLVTDCGCAANEACSTSDTEGRVCRPLDATAAVSSVVCDALADTCPAGHSCLKNGCVRNCRVDADCPTVGSVCVEYAVPELDELWGFCSTSCNVLEPASSDAGYEPCGNGLTCDIIPGGDADTLTLFTHCGFPGAVPEGGACESFLDCGAGLFCYEQACVPMCVFGGAPCANGVQCLVLDPRLVVNGASLGLCDPS